MSSPAENACLLFCVGESVSKRQMAGKPIPEWLIALHRRLSAAVELDEALMSSAGSIVSANGQDFGRNVGQSEEKKLITASEAAQILRVDARTVRRIAADLDGQFAGGRWLFDEMTCRSYAALKGVN